MKSLRFFPALAERLAAGRPVLTRDEVSKLTERVMGMTTADTVNVTVRHTARVITRIANGQVLSGDDGDTFEIWLLVNYEGSNTSTSIRTNQLDDSVLRAIVRESEAIAKQRLRAKEDSGIDAPQLPDSLVPTQLWHDETVRAMSSTRGTVVPDMIDAVQRAGFQASGFLGFMARSEALVKRDGLSVYSEETDAELTMTVRSLDNRTSGWSGQAARNWATVDPMAVAQRAVETARLSANPVALEPGRRIAILTSTAVAQMMRPLPWLFDAYSSDRNNTPFSKQPFGSKWGQQIIDPSITMRSDPNDPDGGYRPYFDWGYGTPAMTWLENGKLKNLAYSIGYAMSRGKPYADHPYSIRVSGGDTSIEAMVAKCDDGIYVNRLSDVELVNRRSGLVTGVTRDGCYLIQKGKITKALKNFRILTSPFFFFNNVIALGPTKRASFGYSPPNRKYAGSHDEWPRLPIITPSLMVRDFNFSALADAV
jgi:predicted Zn-dependent protease